MPDNYELTLEALKMAIAFYEEGSDHSQAAKYRAVLDGTNPDATLRRAALEHAESVTRMAGDTIKADRYREAREQIPG